ncbi:F-box domain-containing protein [Mycena chlorophos]|uniref:F-box domain-containing protein n=1 Tax=Mycena chlorophos TaxID=658473 RepID=A0A8H6TQ21_MYCCL|nr:F-box domain-containing protein [Mycena chlorophos]
MLTACTVNSDAPKMLRQTTWTLISDTLLSFAAMDIPSILAQATSPSFETQSKVLLASTEANVARIDAQIQDLICLREREQATVVALKFVTAPVRKVPMELLVEIFLQVGYAADLDAGIDSEATYGHRRPRTALRARFRLSHVSRYWRTVALRTPRLWVAELPIRVFKDEPAYILMTKQLLDRSAPFPIPIRAVYILLKPSSDGKAKKAASPAILDAIASVADRWSTVYFEGVDIFPALRRLPVGMGALCMPHLSALRIQRQRGEGLTASLDRRWLAPKLTTLDASRMANVSALPIAWSQLTNLTLGSNSPDTILTILLQCTSLVEAKVEPLIWRTPQPVLASPPVVLARLKTLVLNFFSGEGDGDSWGMLFIEPFFDRLSAPALESLELTVNVDYAWTPQLALALAQYLTRSPQLLKFAMTWSSLVAQELVQLLAAMPSVKTFSLDFCQWCITDQVLVRMTDHGTGNVNTGLGPVLLPRLEVLELHTVDDAFSDDVLTAMIQSRWWPDPNSPPVPQPTVSRLETVSLWTGDNDCRKLSESVELQESVKVLQEQGLYIQLG